MNFKSTNEIAISCCQLEVKDGCYNDKGIFKHILVIPTRIVPPPPHTILNIIKLYSYRAVSNI